MKFGILVNAAPYTHQASDTAWRFARAALAKGHRIERVFFYHDGVYNGARFSAPPQDERNLPERWRELAEAHGVDLVVCVSAAQRRGIVDGDDGTLAGGFRISGLGQLIEAAVECDRLMVFGG